MENKTSDINALFALRELIDEKISSIDDTALSKYNINKVNGGRTKIDDAIDKALCALENGDWKPKIRKMLELEEDSWEEAIKKVHKRAHEIGFIETSSDLVDNIEQAFKELYNPPIIKK